MGRPSGGGAEGASRVAMAVGMGRWRPSMSSQADVGAWGGDEGCCGVGREVGAGVVGAARGCSGQHQGVVELGEFFDVEIDELAPRDRAVPSVAVGATRQSLLAVQGSDLLVAASVVMGVGGEGEYQSKASTEAAGAALAKVTRHGHTSAAPRRFR